MSNLIQLLPDHVANQIAAGEVVQRPASVVKELLENSIDAGATSVSLIVKDAGKTLLQIIDDGKGMGVTDARLSFERHATSKITCAEDLFNLNTKGFRGEALASIAAVAQVEMKTKQDADELGTEIYIEGSRIKRQEPCVCLKGTSISVKNLFFNIPARRNFLKSDNVELRNIIDEFQRIALAHSSIAFKLIHNGSEMFNLMSSNLRQRIVAIMGGKTNEKLVPITEETEILSIQGFVFKPEHAKRSRGEQFFFVNDRFIKSSYLHHAVTAAFEGLLHNKAIPSYFLYLKVDPKTLDINIHPTKTEIKFEDEHSIYQILRSAIKHSLGQFQVVPSLDFDRDADLDLTYDQQKTEAKRPTINVDRNFNPFKRDNDFTPFKSSSLASNASFGKTFQADKPSTSQKQAWEDLYTSTLHNFGQTKAQTSHDEIEVESDLLDGSLFQDEGVTLLTEAFQFKRKYIITKLKSGLVVIDQSRAHFRVKYEELKAQLTDTPSVSQQLIFPFLLEFDVKSFSTLALFQEELMLIGFGFEIFTAEEVRITGIPSYLKEHEIVKMLDKLIADFEIGVPTERNDFLHQFALSVAKAASIKNGQLLKNSEQMNLISQLFSCKEPLKTPDNKRIFFTFAVEDLALKF